jgi:hypothetical protein
MEDDANSSPSAAVGGLDAPVAGSTASAAAASGPASASGADAAALRAEDILGCIRLLKEEQSHLREQRKVVNKQLRNQSKRVTRIRKRARLLSDADLVALLKMRHDKPTPSEGVGTSASSGCHPSP